MSLRLYLYLLFFFISVSLPAQKISIDSLLVQLQQADNDSIKAGICSQISYQYLNSDYSKADYFIEKMKGYSLRSNNDPGLAQYYNLKGMQAYKQGEMVRASEYYRLSLERFQKANTTQGQISLHTNLGILNDALGKYHVALNSFQEAYRIIREQNKTHLLAVCLKNIAATHYKLGNYKTAEEYCSQSIKIAHENNQQQILASDFLILANINRRLGRKEEANNEYLNALSIFRDANNIRGIASCELNLSTFYIENLDLDQGMKYSRDALDKFELLDDNVHVAFCLNNMGVISLRQEKGSEAISFFQRSLALQQELGSQNQIATTYKNISDTYSLINNYRKAYLNLKNYTALHDSIFNEEKHKTLAELEAKYKAEQHQATIDLQQAEIDRQKSEKQLLHVFVGSMVLVIAALVWAFFQKQKSNKKIERQKEEISDKNRLLEIQKYELQSSNATKDKMFSIIAHDLRGPIGSLKSFVDILADNKAILDTPRGMKYLKSFQNSANSTFTLLDNLLFWAKSQQGTMEFVPTEQNINDTIEENYELLAPVAKQKQIEFIVECDLNKPVCYDKVMIGIVVRNLMANALKFTPTNGSVHVKASMISNEILISVKDTGVGIPLNNQDKIFDDEAHLSTMGTVNEKGSGLGLILCKEFVQKNHGRIWFKSSPEKGSEFCFTIPANDVTGYIGKTQRQHSA